MIPESEIAAREALKSSPSPKLPSSSRFRHVTWSKKDSLWVPTIKIKGRLYVLGYYPQDEEEQAARTSDLARWYLQDFLPRKPKLNFPEEYADPNFIDAMPERVQNIRMMLLNSGVARNASHFPGYVPEDYGMRNAAPITAPACDACLSTASPLNAAGLCAECHAKYG
jgi:hypothetical protein